jgi:hypothetical protein
MQQGQKYDVQDEQVNSEKVEMVVDIREARSDQMSPKEGS